MFFFIPPVVMAGAKIGGLVFISLKTFNHFSEEGQSRKLKLKLKDNEEEKEMGFIKTELLMTETDRRILNSGFSTRVEKAGAWLRAQTRTDILGEEARQILEQRSKG